MIRIPIKAAKEVALKYGYDQVIIYARKVGEPTEIHGEHLTTYGVNRAHCQAAADIGTYLKTEVFKWPESES